MKQFCLGNCFRAPQEGSPAPLPGKPPKAKRIRLRAAAAQIKLASKSEFVLELVIKQASQASKNEFVVVL